MAFHRCIVDKHGLLVDRGLMLLLLLLEVFHLSAYHPFAVAIELLKSVLASNTED